MHYNKDQVMRGIINYADGEIVCKLPTLGKWVLGTGISIAQDKAGDIVMSLQGNSALKILGIVDDDGNFDIDALAMHMKNSADRYGKASIDIPLIGRMSFSSNDIDTLRSYIERA